MPITENGTTTGTKQSLWCGNQRCEVRDGGGGLANGFQYFANGQVNFNSSGTPTSYYYSKDHLGSIRDMTHGTGGGFTVDSQFSYEPYGRPTLVSGTGATPDFHYAGYYLHSRSGLNLTWFRAYSSGLGRWLSRDPLESLTSVDTPDDFSPGIHDLASS